MKKRDYARYISKRITFVGGIFRSILGAVLILHLIFWVKGEGSVWSVLVLAFMLLAIHAVWWMWIVRPFNWCETMTERILNGYVVKDSLDEDFLYLSPMNKLQTEKIISALNGPQVVDLNKRQAQYMALQNQINPHFLYNTLESIRGEALIAGADSVADMTEALAKFFRYTITKVENLVSVQEELDNCETYFMIQKYRFGDRIEMHVECNAEDWNDIMNCKIPKLTLQPILENSIIHGTELKVGTGNLIIAFERTKDRLVIWISDDGVGMDEESLAKLNSRLRRDNNTWGNAEQKEKGGIALVNVNNRIHLIFGEEYGMHIYSIPNKGTDVEITVPLLTNEANIRSRGIL